VGAGDRVTDGDGVAVGLDGPTHPVASRRIAPVQAADFTAIRGIIVRLPLHRRYAQKRRREGLSMGCV
jgi:hypothetical protein